MPRPTPVYDATPTSQTVPFQLPSGAGMELIIWQDVASDIKLVKCDICGRFMPLQGRGMSMSALKRHRDGAGCKALAKQNANQPSQLADFINTFQSEVPGPSNPNSSCELILS